MLAEVTLKAYLKSGSNWVINKPQHSRFEFGRDFWVDFRIFWDDLFGGFQQKGGMVSTGLWGRGQPLL